MNREYLREYVGMYDATEIPPLFSLWCGIFGVAAVMGRKVFIDMGTFAIYPNFYIILVAGSGRCRKSTAIRQIDKVLRDVGKLNMISQKLSPQALIEAMNELPEGIIFSKKNTSEGVIIVDEMANFLNKGSYEAGMAPLLISFYDCENNIEYRTKARGKEMVHNSCLNILAGTTIDWLRDGIPADAVGGGLTSRMLFVYVDVPRPPIAFPSITPQQVEARTWITLDLKRIAALNGPMRLTPGAIKSYAMEYEQFYYNSKMNDNPHLSGYASRRGVHLLKIACVLSVMDSSNLVITDDHISRSKSLLQMTEQMLPQLLRIISSSESGNNVEFVLNIVAKDKQISRSDLVRRVSHKLDARSLNEVITTLNHSGLITSTLQGSVMYYTFIGQGI